jgi:hypothetical protein
MIKTDKHFYLKKVGEASEIPAPASAGRSVRSKLTAPGQGERGWWVIHGHWEGYGRLVVTGFRTDGYPQGVRWLWTWDEVWRGPVRWAKGLPPFKEPREQRHGETNSIGRSPWSLVPFQIQGQLLPEKQIFSGKRGRTLQPFFFSLKLPFLLL